MTTLEAAYQYIDRTINADGIADLGRDGLAVIMAGFADDQRRRMLTDPLGGVCPVCNGLGQVIRHDGTDPTCPACGGKTP